jgi:hypothetical protein
MYGSCVGHQVLWCVFLAVFESAYKQRMSPQVNGALVEKAGRQAFVGDRIVLGQTAIMVVRTD